MKHLPAIFSPIHTTSKISRDFAEKNIYYKVLQHSLIRTCGKMLLFISGGTLRKHIKKVIIGKKAKAVIVKSSIWLSLSCSRKPTTL